MNPKTAPRKRLSRHPGNPSGNWLSLFAMLMIFIGPLISQAMPMDQHAGMSMEQHAGMSAGMDMSSHADMPAHHAMSGEHADNLDASPAPTASADHVLWAKCGYCTLLFSCPALPQALAIIVPGAPRPPGFFSAAPQQGHAQRSIFPNARSRAPPLPSWV